MNHIIMRHDHHTHIKHLIHGVLVAWMGLAPVILHAQTPSYAGTELGTPAYSYYLAVEVIQAYQDLFQITDTYDKKPISANLKPQNVYERTLGVMEEFDTLFPGGLSQAEQEAVYAVDPRTATPTEISAILSLIKRALVSQGARAEYGGQRTSKTPDEVYQIMRRIGWYHREIAERKGLTTTWDSVDRVYETVVYKMLPIVYAIADQSGIAYEPYAFPRQPARDVKPRNIYKLVIAVYDTIMQYKTRSGSTSDMVTFVTVTDCDDITPADVFDLEQIVAAELKLHNPEITPSEDVIQQFQRWRSTQDSLVPGHTFRLLGYSYLLTHRALENGE